MNGQTIKRVLILEPSVIIAEGLKHVVDDLAGFDVCGMITELEGGLETTLEAYDTDIIIVDPAIADIRSRSGLHETIKNLTGVPVLAILTSATDAGFTQDYEGQIYLSDKTADVEQKISAAVNVNANETRGDGEELSAREKEILVCVAKGMLNKEIADHYKKNRHKDSGRSNGIRTAQQPDRHEFHGIKRQGGKDYEIVGSENWRTGRHSKGKRTWKFP